MVSTMKKTIMGFYFLLCASIIFGVATPLSLAAVKPLAVIFKGRSICDGCETPFIKIFKDKGYDVRFVKPGESTQELLAKTYVYVIPGGEDVGQYVDGHSTSIKDAPTKADLDAIRSYVLEGGRYYGVCLGGYWAGKEGSWPGTLPEFQALRIIPATVLELSAHDKRDKVIDVLWNGKTRKVYFQDGPSFEITDPSLILKTYATYEDNKKVAVFLAKYGKGKVGISGVHLEAPLSWYKEARLKAPAVLSHDLQDEILGDLLK